jgi:hypothetical protein
MGEGYEPHVDEEDGKLTYGLPVDSSFVSLSFSFEIGQADLDVLLTDPYRRAVLESVAHTVLQRSMIRGNPKVTPAQFREVVDRVLHAPAAAVEAYIVEIDRDYHMSTAYYVERNLARRAADSQTG